MSIVVLVVLALAAGLVVGYVRRGRLRHLTHPPPTRNRLLLTALGLHVVGVFASWAWESSLAVFSALGWLVVAFYAWVNRWMPGARLVALGLAANSLVLLLNGAVPVSPQAASRAGADVSALTSSQNAMVVDDATRLTLLAKNVPVAFPPRREVVSPGDIAIAAGLATIIATGMVGRWPNTNALPLPRRKRNPYPYDGWAAAAHDEELADDTDEIPSATATAGSHSAHTGAGADDDADATMEQEPDSGAKPIRPSASA